MKKVHIVGPDYLVSKMFIENNWRVVDDPEEADLIQFTGGEDVDPSYYKQIKHPSTYSNPKRDAREALVFNSFVGKKPMAGICRGGQLLNVLSGGSMYQHVTKHGLRDGHDAVDLVSGDIVQVTSVHHQMMIPSDKAEIVMVANQGSTKYEPDGKVSQSEDDDIEAVFYDHTKSLCFQPHPEYVDSDHPCHRVYFNYLNKFFNL